MTMEREILFQGKRLTDGQWVRGSLVRLHTGQCMIFEPCGGRLFPVDPKTVGQYTGKTDKSGTKILMAI